MKIGIDAVTILVGKTGGIETYTIELIRALVRAPAAHEYVVFAQPGLAEAVGVDSPALRFVEVAHGARSLGAAFTDQLAWMPRAARRAGVDLIHHVKNYAAAAHVPQVLTLHDMFPEYFLRREPQRDGWQNLARTLLMCASARMVRRVLTVSEAAARHIEAVTGLGRDRVGVTPIAPKRMVRGGDHPFPALDAGYFLTLGKTAGYKNLPRLIRAFLRARTGRRLVVAGLPAFLGGAVARETHELAARSGGRVFLAGYVAEGRLAPLYERARAFLFPSLIEGFGLPPLEAASLGVPVAVSDIDVHREVMDDAALRFDPVDEAAIAAAIERLDGDDALCGRLSAMGPQRARHFSWDATARLTLAAYEAAAA
ncbi:MAG TPA: glycosyltransferase family 1 protein [Polyangia bacterium]|jgi:glycosyltransferase involved in cell wall biosynthesis